MAGLAFRALGHRLESKLARKPTNVKPRPRLRRGSFCWCACDEAVGPCCCRYWANWPTLERAEQDLILQGVEGKNEAERRARMASVLARQHLAVEQAERQCRVARREREEHSAALHLVRQRIDALKILAQLRPE